MDIAGCCGAGFILIYAACNDKIIAWMDTDAAFITPVTSIFNGTKLRVLGCDCRMGHPVMQSWANATKAVLGLPMVANFMTYFPVYLYRDTLTLSREHILKRFNASNFEEAFKKFYHQEKELISPVTIIMSCAFFEKGRYDWNINICNDLNTYNKRFPSGHVIGQEHIANIFSEPQTAFHVPYAPVLSSRILVSYCLSHKAGGNTPAICSTRNSNFSLSDNLVLFNHNIEQAKTLKETPCAGNNRNVCLKVVERHHKKIGLEIKKNERKIDW